MERAPVVSVNTRGCIQFTDGKRSGPKHLSLDGFGWLRKLPSSRAGFTFNWENPDTDYTTGTEFHIEWALVQHLSKTLAVGIAGYHHQQVTGDSGAGATLGDFKGRVTALGPGRDLQLPARQNSGQHAVVLPYRVDRLDAGLLTISMPCQWQYIRQG